MPIEISHSFSDSLDNRETISYSNEHYFRGNETADTSKSFRRSGNFGNKPVSLKQLKIALGKAGMSIRKFEMIYEAEILDAFGEPAYGAMAVDGRGNPIKGNKGHPIIRISNLGLSSLLEAVATVFHEIHHIRAAMSTGAVSTETDAEPYAQKMVIKFKDRYGK